MLNKSFRIFFLTSLLFFLICDTSLADESSKLTWTKQVVKESLLPIRPGIPEKVPFWNEYAKRFIYAPAFNIKVLNAAKNYRFTASIDKKKYVFEADHPWSPLTPIWEDLPVGSVTLEVAGLDQNKQIIGITSTRKFYRAAMFSGNYFQSRFSYQESARKALAHLFQRAHYENWLKTGRPDTTYELYCYPAKIIGAVVRSMVLYTKLAPDNTAKALKISQNAAKYLIKISESAGTPLEYFPPTYAGEARTAGKYQGQNMLIYPAEVGKAYLDLYEKTDEPELFEAALKIAETYSKLQLPGGSWYLKLDSKTGKPVTQNLCIPINIIEFMERLAQQFDVTQFQSNKNLAFNWIVDNCLKTFNWEGQFEDVAPSQPYRNLSKHQACSFAIYLFKHFPEDSNFIKSAEELLRFAEDQFVVWEKPMPQKRWQVAEWITPCALEQYSYYVPVDASAAKLIATFQKAYQVTGKKLYLAKAQALANTMTVVQDSVTGRYPTYWERNQRGKSAGWINCATYDAKVMYDLGKMLNLPPVYFQAHRGGRGEVPENTMAAFRYAWKLGAIPEADIRTTKDDIIICFHDKTLARTTNAPDMIKNIDLADLDFHQILPLDAGISFDPRFKGERIPTLVQVLREMRQNPTYQIYLDLKQTESRPFNLEKLGWLIKKLNVGKQIIFCHNQQKNLITFQKIAPDVRTMLWIGGKPADIKRKYFAARESGFKGLNQVQLHLHRKNQSETIHYLLETEFLKAALNKTSQRGVDLELLPYEFNCNSIENLLNLGIRWLCTDHPLRLTNCINKWREGRQP